MRARRWLIRSTAAALTLVGLVAVAFGLDLIVRAAQKWGLPEAELAPFVTAFFGGYSAAYGALMIALAVAGLRGERVTAAASMTIAGILSTLVGAYLYLNSDIEAWGALILIVGVGSLIAAGVAVFPAKEREK